MGAPTEVEGAPTEVDGERPRGRPRAAPVGDV